MNRERDASVDFNELLVEVPTRVWWQFVAHFIVVVFNSFFVMVFILRWRSHIGFHDRPIEARGVRVLTPEMECHSH